MDFSKQFEKVLVKANEQIIAMVGNVDNMEMAIALKQEAIRILGEAGYDELVAKFLNEESSIIKSEIAKYKNAAIPVKFAKGDVKVIQALQKKELLDLMNLKENVARKIQEITAQGVMTSMTKRELAAQIGVIKDVQARHIGTYLVTARNQYIQKLHDLSAEKYEKDTGEKAHWEYVGAPEDDLTRDECRLALQKQYFTDAEKRDFENGALFDAGVPRYNCRHSFVPITKDVYEGGIGGR